MDLRVIRVRCIYSDGRHNAFTGITELAGVTFVSFRSATTHVSYDGKVKLIASDDRDVWRVEAEFDSSDGDLRDPKVVAFQNKLFVYAGKRFKEEPCESFVFVRDEGGKWSEGQRVEGIPKGHWLWWAKPYGDTLYGAAYKAGKRPRTAAFYRSTEGLSWEFVADFPVPANEVSFDFGADGRLWALLREDTYGGVPALCSAPPPYTKFDRVQRLPMRLQGPMLKRLDRGCVIICRQWDMPGRRNLRTDVFWLGDGCDPRRIRSLPSGGDTSYAGWLDVGPGAAVVSYYSSHAHKMDEPHTNEAAFGRDKAHAEHTTPADIYLADVSYPTAEPK